jgi:transcriptional regulator with XRE-family HTH domain
MSTPIERLANYIKEKVGEKSLREVARDSSTLTNYQAITRIYSGKSTPNLDTFINIAEAINADPFEMLEAYLGRPHIDREDETVRIALEWARLATKQGDRYWIKKILQDNEKLRELIAAGRVAKPEPEANGNDGDDVPKKPRGSGGGESDMIHKHLSNRIAV